jgi:signal transduction histidine kinase
LQITRIVTELKFLFRRILKPGFESIAWQIIYRVEIMGIGMAIIYLVYDFFFNEGPQFATIGLVIFPFYILLLILVLKYPGNKIVRNIVVISNFLSMIVSFLFLAGKHYVSTPTIIDFSLSLLVVTIVYRDLERIIWAILHSIVFIFFISLSLLSYSTPEPDLYMLQSRPDFMFAHVEIISRLVFIFVLGYTFIKDYDHQRRLVIQKNEEVNHLNKNLEELVKIRTERLNELNKRLREYSFLNSHKVRAPLSKIMGITNLIKAEKFDLPNSNLPHYLDLMQMSTDELDRVIQEMNAYLSEKEEENS